MNRTVNYNFIPESLKVLLRKTKFYKNQAVRHQQVLSFPEIEDVLNHAPPVLLDHHLNRKPTVGIIKTLDIDLIDNFANPKASWLRYERFCKTNRIPYEFYDIKKSNWMDEAKKYDIVVCHTPSTPSYQDMIESKIYVLENMMGILCFPSYNEVWQYENKNRASYLYKYFDLPSIPTYVTHSKIEAYDLINRINYPFITKTYIGASSSGVLKVKTKKQAKKLINNIFSKKGLTTQFPYQNQKDYFYIQEFIDDATYDLRVMMVGDMAFGYYRFPKKGDYRASGAGIIVKKAIPEEVLRLAVDIKNKLNSRQLGVDLLYSEKRKKYYIIETSLFNQIDTPEQLAIDGVAGYYDTSDLNNIKFREGKYWIQELAIRNIIIEWGTRN